MSKDIIVDTSVFVDYFRGKGDEALAVLVISNSVLLSQVVRFEILVGVRKSEGRKVDELFQGIRAIAHLPTPNEIENVIHKAKGSGLLGGLADLLILADALKHGASLWTSDKKMQQLARHLRVPLFSSR